MFTRLFGLLVLVVATVAVSPPTQAYGAPITAASAPRHQTNGPTRGYYTRYYSDATYSQQVGWKIFSCSGTITTGGRTSTYYETEWVDCDGIEP